MRLFVAVDLDERARRQATAAMVRLRRHCEEASRDFAHILRWVPPDKLHLTLHFLGEVDSARLPALRAALAAPLMLRAFDLSLGAPGVFPLSGPARVVWLDVAAGAGELSALHAELGARLREHRFELEQRSFAPHLTLARLKSPPPTDLAWLIQSAVIEPVAPWRVDHVTLYRSQLSAAGSLYGAVLRMELAP